MDLKKSGPGRKFFAFLVAILISVTVFLLMIQERLIFYPTKIPDSYQYKFKNFLERKIDFEGKKLDSLFFVQKNSDVLFLYFHGNAGDLSRWGEVASDIRDEAKVNVWIIDYPGYGKSEGSISSEKQLLDLAILFYEKAKAELPDFKIIAYGRSIGSGPAAWLASQKKIPLILETPYASFSKLAAEIAPWFPSFLRRYNFDTMTWLKDFKLPTLILHGNKDEVIPYAHSELLAEKIKNNSYTLVKGATHNDLALHPEYWTALRGFLKQKL